ncbi:unnamed protein product [Bursaphelenchus xylophilus]|uniref:(pine wood nematode) hypothetical protein n=1 Tax=Bursaphelenchus xylophilus TaxID=6326 RepID=A0A1I7RQ86_BURXY|nr:unnamed protein product [Bursaphelenchus xylophilus]CAG9097314.1 unnamed protein product [Bursaphelenchus xylophilus]
MRLTLFSALFFKLILLTSIIYFWNILLDPSQICWSTGQRVPHELRRSLKKNNGFVCYPINLEANLLCSPEQSRDWWKVEVFTTTSKDSSLCIPRRNVFYSLAFQSFWIILLQFIHLISLVHRQFECLSPLDFVPCFFNLAGLSSIYLILYILRVSWADIWTTSRISPPSDFMDYGLLNIIMYFLVIVTICEWLMFHVLYLKETQKDKMEPLDLPLDKDRDE